MKLMTYITLIILLTIFFLTGPIFAGSTKKIVLVPPFENLSNTKSMTSYEVATSNSPDNPKRKFTIDRYSEIPRGMVEDLLVQKGVNVVERQRVDQLLLESEFIRLSGLVTTENVIKMGKMLGANTIIMGTIQNIQSKKKTFSGYSIKTSNIKVICSVRIRIIDIESGNIKFSKIFKGNALFESSNFGGETDSDVAYTVIEDAIEQLKDDEEFIKYFDEKINQKACYIKIRHQG